MLEEKRERGEGRKELNKQEKVSSSSSPDFGRAYEDAD